MIKRNVTVKLQGSRAVVDSPIYLYQYDKNICLVITLLNNRYEYDKDTKLSFTLVKPNGATVESSLSAIIQGKYYITLTGEMLDGAEEIGQNLIQIRQHSDKGVVSLPPFAIHVLKSYVQPIPIDGVENTLLTENEYMLLTENQRAIEVFGTVKISELPITTDVNGYIPVTQDDMTYKLDISNFALEEDLEHNHDSQYADINHNHDTVYATKEELVHNHDKQYAPLSHEHEQYLTEHQDISHLASRDFVKTEIANAQLNGEGEDIDLSIYATKNDLATKADKKHTHEEYLTQHQDISHLATKQELVHNHDNDYAPKEHTHSQYLTQHQSLEHLATKQEVQAKADEEHTHSYNDLTDKPNLDEKASISYVDNAVANVTVDTSDLATKEELNAKANAEHTHDNYLTEHQDLSHLALKTEIPSVEGMVTSTTITRIELVDTIPSQQEQGVLYIVKAGE
jgi:hypothetical protein